MAVFDGRRVEGQHRKCEVQNSSIYNPFFDLSFDGRGRFSGVFVCRQKIIRLASQNLFVIPSARHLTGPLEFTHFFHYALRGQESTPNAACTSALKKWVNSYEIVHGRGELW